MLNMRNAIEVRKHKMIEITSNCIIGLYGLIGNVMLLVITQTIWENIRLVNFFVNLVCK